MTLMERIVPIQACPQPKPGGGRMGLVTERTTTAPGATLHTSAGDIRLNLFATHAPKTAANFTGLAEGRKDNTHRNTTANLSGQVYPASLFHPQVQGFLV